MIASELLTDRQQIVRQRRRLGRLGVRVRRVDRVAMRPRYLEQHATEFVDRRQQLQDELALAHPKQRLVDVVPTACGVEIPGRLLATFAVDECLDECEQVFPSVIEHRRPDVHLVYPRKRIAKYPRPSGRHDATLGEHDQMGAMDGHERAEEGHLRMVEVLVQHARDVHRRIAHRRYSSRKTRARDRRRVRSGSRLSRRTRTRWHDRRIQHWRRLDSHMAECAMEHTDPAHAPARRLPIGRLVLGLAAVIGLIALGREVGGYLPTFVSWVASLGVWGPVVFMGGYVVGVVAFVPGSILTLSAGAIFGIVNGTVIVFVSATIASAVSFLISRHLVRDAVEQKLAGNERFASIDRAIASQGRKIVLLLRLSPVFPYSLLNYALGLTQIRFVDYVLASVGTIPATLLYVYYGKLAGDVAALAGGAAVQKDTGYYVVLGLGLVATIAVTTVVTRIARSELSKATEQTD